jgi:hypothetical protein
MKQDQSRRNFLRKSAIAGSLVILPGGFSKLVAGNQQINQTNLSGQPASWFSTGGETIYHLKTGKTDTKIPRSIFAAAFSGNILCFDFSGKKLWEQNTGKFFPFAMDVLDIDGDGFDECVIASADGSLYIIDHDGKLLAKLCEGKPPLYSVKIVKDNQGKQAIYCGGAEKIIYQLSPKGEILAQKEMIGIIRNIDSGTFSKTAGLELVVAVTTNNATLSLCMFSLPDFQLKMGPVNSKEKRKYNLITIDQDQDGLDLIIIGDATGGVIYDSKGSKMGTLMDKPSVKGRDVFRQVLLAKIPSKNGNGEQLIGLCSSDLRFYGTDGSITKQITMDISPAALCYDDATKTILMGSDIGGGDTIFCARLDMSEWEQTLQKLGYQGQQKTIIANIEKLSAQIEAFEAPSYQPKVNPEVVCVFPAFKPHVSGFPYSPSSHEELYANPTVKALMTLYKSEFPYPSMHFTSNQWFSEKYDRTFLKFGWDKVRDARMTYQLTSAEIIDYARMHEANGFDFIWTIGHGNDPFFTTNETIEGILRAAPNTCIGFIIPEVAVEDTPGFRYAVVERIKPICDLCIKFGNKKVFLRSKWLFWIADIKTDLWDWILKDKKYKDVIVPAMEETNQRVCDTSISARMGLQLGGWVTDWAGRAVHDNLAYEKIHNWATPAVGSNFLRALCYTFSLGTKYNLIQLSEADVIGEKAHFRDHALVVKPYLHMLGKGILPWPQKPEDKLSVSSVAVQMKTPSKEFMTAVHGGHDESTYKYDPKWVFSRLECFWGQAPTPKYDFGYYAIGRRRQALNFVPKNPYGLVPIVPDENSVGEIPGIEKKITTDGEVWYDEQGKKRSAAEYAPIIEKTLQKASEKLFCKVTGDVAWTATRLDKSHIRLVLIDPGYLDPADRKAQISIVAKMLSGTDILSREKLKVKSNSILITIPMGVLRIIDIEHKLAKS